jgi:hypothetical protein
MQAYIEYRNDSNIIFSSYYTPIVVKHNGIWLTSNKKYSSTTSRQKNRFMRELMIRPTLVEHDYFLTVLRLLGVNKGLA